MPIDPLLFFSLSLSRYGIALNPQLKADKLHSHLLINYIGRSTLCDDDDFLCNLFAKLIDITNNLRFECNSY